MGGKERKRRMSYEERKEKENKQRAREYILDPLTAPEPSQECGPGSSFITPLRRSLTQSRSVFADPKPQSKRPSSGSKGKRSAQKSSRPSPDPATSRLSFEDISPFADSRYPAQEIRRPHIPTRSQSLKSTVSSTVSQAPPESKPRSTTSKSFGRYPPNSALTRGYSNNHVHENPSVKPPNSPPENPMAPPRPPLSRSNSGTSAQDPTGRPRRSLSQRYPGDMSHRPLDMLRREARAADRAPHLRTPSGASGANPETASVSQASVASSNPFADPVPDSGSSKHRRKSSSSRRKPFTDTIDRLDEAALGGTYHHSGPYDAVSAARNVNPKYAPLEAVKDSNAEALKATPTKCVEDSITNHVPLDGTARIPPGMPDPRTGEVLEYKEGADLMREPDAAGGAYKRWEGIPYHPDDLKGKGDPSYSIEKRLKDNKRRRKSSHPPPAHANSTIYEMGPMSSTSIRRSGSVNSAGLKKETGVSVRRRSMSASEGQSTGTGRNGHSSYSESDRYLAPGDTEYGGLGRNNSRGGLSEGLKRRFGSLRRKGREK